MMPQRRKRRLKIIVLALTALGIAAGLVLYALKQNISLYQTPAELLSHQPASAQQSIRLGGLVMQGSVKHLQGVTVHFQVTDFEREVPVVYQGVLPTLFREGQGVVMDGNFDPSSQVFTASRVLAKHDENYRPPGIAKRRVGQ